MRTVRKDDRTNDQKITHRYLVTATDKFMSGWGGAQGGKSKCAWACDSKEKMYKVLDWVNSRAEMKYVNYTFGDWRPSGAHIHIYVVENDHPALR
jgi:hypothetical protein